MKVNKSDIIDKLRLLKTITPKGADSMKGVLVEGNTLTANNLEFAVRTTFETDNTDKFVLPVSAIDVIDKLPSGEIEITPTASGKSVSIKTDIGKSRYSTIPVDDFPTSEFSTLEQDNASITINSEVFREAVSSVMYACSDDENKPAVQRGVLFEGRNGKLNIVSCDGANLAWNEVEYQGEIYCVIPKAVLKKILSIDMGESVAVYEDGKNKVTIKTGEYIVQATLLSGNFIEYGRVFRQTPKVHIEVDRLDFIKTFERISTVIGANKIPAKIERADNELIISCATSTSAYDEAVKAEFDTYESVLLGINPKFVIACFKSFDESRVMLSYSSETQALIVSGETFKAVMMPARLR